MAPFPQSPYEMQDPIPSDTGASSYYYGPNESTTDGSFRSFAAEVMDGLEFDMAQEQTPERVQQYMPHNDGGDTDDEASQAGQDAEYDEDYIGTEPNDGEFEMNETGNVNPSQLTGSPTEGQVQMHSEIAHPHSGYPSVAEIGDKSRTPTTVAYPSMPLLAPTEHNVLRIDAKDSPFPYATKTEQESMIKAANKIIAKVMNNAVMKAPLSKWGFQHCRKVPQRSRLSDIAPESFGTKGRMIKSSPLRMVPLASMDLSEEMFKYLNAGTDFPSIGETNPATFNSKGAPRKRKRPIQVQPRDKAGKLLKVTKSTINKDDKIGQAKEDPSHHPEWWMEKVGKMADFAEAFYKEKRPDETQGRLSGKMKTHCTLMKKHAGFIRSAI